MGTLKLKKHLPILKIARINLKHNAKISILMAAILVLITPVIFGTSNLDQETAAIPLEMLVSFVGVVLFTPVFQPEQNREIEDVVSAKYVDTAVIYLIRTAYAFLFAASFICLFCVYMRLQRCDVTFQLMAGTLANAVFLGSLGMITAVLTDNTIIAYMIPLVYYMMNYGIGSKFGFFYLFSMSSLDFKPKIWLFITGIILLFASVILKNLKRKFR